MAEITAAIVKQLRDMTGAGMMECKKALTEAEGDMDAAVDVLRTRGKAAAKKAGRATNEGVVAFHICEKHGSAGMLEVNCETDFVARTDKFKAFTDTIAKTVAMTATRPTSMTCSPRRAVRAPASRTTDRGHPHLRREHEHARFARIDPEDNGAIDSYIHMGGKIGVLVKFAFNNAETAKNEAFVAAGRDVCMQVAAAAPVAVDRDSVDPAIVAHEMEIYKAQAAESGKPENIQEKIATGRMEKYYKEFCLVEQEFVKDPDKTIRQYLADISKQVGDEIAVAAFDARPGGPAENSQTA